MQYKIGYENDGGPQCWNCKHCLHTKEVYLKYRLGSAFLCDVTGGTYDTWHLNVPEECPCRGEHFAPVEECKESKSIL